MSKQLFSSLFILICSMIISVLLTLNSSAGLRVLLFSWNLYSDIQIQAEKINGSILSGKINAEKLKVKVAEQFFYSDSLIVKWQPEKIWQQQLQIEAVEINNLGFGQPNHNKEAANLIASATYDSKTQTRNFLAINWQNMPYSPSGLLQIQQKSNHYQWQLDSTVQAFQTEKAKQLSGKGLVKKSEDGLTFQESIIKNGRTALFFKGQLTENWQIDYQFDLPELQKYSQKTTGSISIAGKLRGTFLQPRHESTLTLEDIEYDHLLSIHSVIHSQQHFNNNHLAGKTQASSLTVKLPLYGLTLNSNDLTLSHHTLSDLTLEGQINSQEGQLQLRGKRHEKNSSPSTSVTVSLENFLLQNTEEAKIWLTGQAHWQLEKKQETLDANLIIPKAKIAPRNLKSAVNTSPDVKIIGQTQNNNNTLFDRLNSTIHIKLGEAVEFNGFDLKSRVGGELTVSKSPDKLALANGELNLSEASYVVYGTELQVNIGRLTYTHSPLDNPTLNLNAEREVEIINTALSELQLQELQTNNQSLSSSKAVIGVSVSGTVQAPHVSFYSTPTMSEADRLSYLLLGVPSNNASAAQGQLLFTAAQEMAASLGFEPQKDLANKLHKWTPVDTVNITSSQYIDQQTGESKMQTSLVLGKQLSPHLYLNYAIGLINPVNILEVQYRLSRRWQLRSQTDNQGQGGGDLIYTIEK